MLTKTLSLDLGTASIGWAVRDNNFEKSPESIIASGVVIFPKGFGTDKNNAPFSLAAERRKARLIRRQLYRRRLRKFATLKRLIKAGMAPLTMEEARKWAKPEKGQRSEYPCGVRFHQWLRLIPANGPLRATAFANIYQLRSAAEKGELEKFTGFGFSLEELLGRIIYNYAQRRGFKTNAKDGRGGDAGKVNPAIEKLKEKFGGKTMAEFFANVNPFEGRIRNRKINTPDHFLAREMFEEELGRVVTAYPQILSPHADSFKKVLFYVRPLKSQKEKVGSCSLEKGKARIPLSHPDFELFRLRQYVQNLRFEASKGEELSLNNEDSNLLIGYILDHHKARLSKNDLEIWLSKNFQRELKFHNDEKERKVLPSPPVPCCKMLKEVLGDAWKTRILIRTYDQGPRKGQKAQIAYNELWHFLREVQERPEKFKSENPISEYAAALGLGEDAAKRMQHYVEEEMPSGYASLSLFAIKRILEMMNDGHPYHTAVLLAGMKRVLGEMIWAKEGDIITQDLRDYDESLPMESLKAKVYNDLLNRLKDFGEISTGNDIEVRVKFYYGARKWNSLKKDNEADASGILNTITTRLKIATDDPKNADYQKGPNLQDFVRERIKDKLTAEGNWDEQKLETKLNRLYHHSAISKWKDPEYVVPEGADPENGYWQLPTPYTGAIQNPAAMRVLHQCRKLINFLLSEGILDRDSSVVVEMARELNDSNQRAAIEAWNEIQRKENEEASRFIKDYLSEGITDQEILSKYQSWLFELPNAAGPLSRRAIDIKHLGNALRGQTSDDLIQKLRLWKEQKGICLYSGKPISPSDVLDGTSTQIEHTIPRSLSNDTTMENLTLATAKANARKENRIPFDVGQGDSILSDYKTIMQRIQPWVIRIKELEGDKDAKDRKEREGLISSKTSAVRDAKRRGDDKSYNDRVKERWLLKFERNYWRSKVERFKMEEVKDGFSRRQLTDTQVITKYAAGWLKTLFKHVKGTKGSLTAQLRKSWGLQAMYEKKDRTNHTHHLVDAVVNAMIEPRLYNQLAAAYRNAEENRRKEIRLDLPWDGFAADVENLCENTLVYHVHKDNTLRHSKFAVQNRKGKIEYKQGKGIKAPLHMETALANVRAWEEKPDGELRWKKDEEGRFTTVYATRKEMAPGTKTIFPKLKEYADDRKSEFDKDGKKEILPVLRLRMKDGKRIELERLTEADLANLKENDLNAHFLNVVRARGLGAVKRDGFYLPVNKARITKAVQVPPKVRPVQTAFQQPDRPHKHYMHYENDSNYALAIYRNHQGKKEKRTFLVQPYLGLTAEKAQQPFPLTLHEKGIDYDLAGPSGGLQVFRMGQRVLLYGTSTEEIWNDTSQENLVARLYVVRGINQKRDAKKDGRVYFYGQITVLNHFETGKTTTSKGILDDLPTSAGVWITDGLPNPKILFYHSQINALIEGIDFQINHLGEIEKL